MVVRDAAAIGVVYSYPRRAGDALLLEVFRDLDEAERRLDIAMSRQ